MGGAISVVLSIAMVIGIFAGTGFEVEAAGGLYYEEFTPPDSYKELVAMCLNYMELTCGEDMQYNNDINLSNNVGVLIDYINIDDTLIVKDNTGGTISNTYTVTDQPTYELMKKNYQENTKWFILKRSGEQPTSGRFVEITDEKSIDDLENLALDAPLSQYYDTKNSKPDNKYFVFGIWDNWVRYYAPTSKRVFSNKISKVKSVLKNALNEGTQVYIWVSDKPTTSETASQGENETSAPHTHSYSWVTVQDVNAEQDGIEEYRCSCGDVQERCVLPRYMAIVKGLYGAVKDAPQNGTATFDTGSAFTMTDYVIRKLAERTDVTTVITFKYQSQSYKMTIPAGADYTELLSDSDYFYGYFYFANAVGATIEAL